MDTQTVWNLRIGASGVNVQKYRQIIFKVLDGWIASWCSFLHRQCPTDSNLLHSRQNLKEIKCVCKISFSKYRKFTLLNLHLNCPVGWGCRIHRLHLCWGVRPPNEYPGYDTKQSDGKVPVMLELWGMQSTPSLPLLPGPLWSGMVSPDKGPVYGLNITKQHTYAKLNCVN